MTDKDDNRSMEESKGFTIPDWTLGERFDYIANCYPDKAAVISFSDMEPSKFSVRNVKDYSTISKLMQYCFIPKKYLVFSTLNPWQFLIRSNDNRCTILDKTAYQLYSSFDGSKNMWDIYQELKEDSSTFSCEVIEPETAFSQENIKNVRYEFIQNNIYHILYFTEILFTLGILKINKCKIIQLGKDINFDSCSFKVSKVNIKKYWTEEISEIFLFGDKAGIGTVGILYLASYLRKNGINAKCLYINDAYTKDELEKTIITCLKNAAPRYVGLSMKWFPHICRIFEMASIIKNYDTTIKVIVGGDTASYYAEQVIGHPDIDFLVCGDGEEALKQICKGNPDPINTYSKKDGSIIKPSQYHANNEDSDISLLPLNTIAVDAILTPLTTLYIPTSKGCYYDCVQCGGTKKIQENIFHRTKVLYTRRTDLVRKDIIHSLNWTTAYMYSIGSMEEDYKYFKTVWDGIDLSGHFCAMFNTSIINYEIVKLAVNTFCYVRFAVDICSLSHNHRERMNNRTQGKIQVTDDEIIRFFDFCEQFDNCDVDIYTIAGMPFYQEADMEEDKILIERLKQYRCFHNIEWGRLHAQPGSLLSMEAEKYGMQSDAVTYEDFLEYSKKNYNLSNGYPDMQSYQYPYICYSDNNFMQRVLLHFMELSININKWKAESIRFQKITQEISYKELCSKAEHIGSILIKDGLKKDDRVILMLQDRIKLSIAIWAIIKAGGIYVPLDPVHHRHIINDIAESLNIFCVITDIELECKQKINYDDLLSIEQENVLHVNHSKDKILYSIYSSGTTGKAKAISIKQIGIINYTSWRIKNYNINDSDVILQPLSEAFDGFGSNYYTSMLSGATLIMPTSDQNRNIPLLKDLVDKYKVSHTSMLPFVYELLIQNSNGRFGNMRSVVLAGDVGSVRMIRMSREVHPDVLLINEYGPTENSIASTSYIGMDEEHINCIGKPIDGVNVYIINKEGKQATVNEPGEIGISGVGLFYGYYPDTFNNEIYKTGDIGKYDSNGNIFFMGRDTRIIKKSGMLINLDINEKTIEDNTMVLEVAEILKNDQIYAYIVLKSGYTIEQLKNALKLTIPLYQLPSLYIVLDRLPRLPGGKVDYSSLDAIELRDVLPDISCSALHKRIVELWENELGHKQFGLDENFFDIGGNSLMIMKIYNEIDNEYPNKFSPTDLFTYHTINKLAEYMDTKLS